MSLYIEHFYVVTGIHGDIHKSSDYGPLSLDQVLTYFYVKSSKEYYMIYTGSNKPGNYFLPNKSPCMDGAKAYEISMQYTIEGDLWLLLVVTLVVATLCL